MLLTTPRTSMRIKAKAGTQGETYVIRCFLGRLRRQFAQLAERYLSQP